MVRADAVDCYDNKRGHDVYSDAYNDARYDMHVNNDEVRVDEVHQAAMGDGAVRADVVVAVQMHISLPADK